MGIPAERRAVRSMLDRWKRDEARLQDLFNRGAPVDTNDLTDAGEILRNIGTAIAYANAWLARFGN